MRIVRQPNENPQGRAATASGLGIVPLQIDVATEVDVANDTHAHTPMSAGPSGGVTGSCLVAQTAVQAHGQRPARGLGLAPVSCNDAACFMPFR